MFRKFIVPGIQKRFKGAFASEAMFNYRLNTYEEGTYVTMGRFMVKVLKDLKQLQFNLIAHGIILSLQIGKKLMLKELCQKSCLW